ncbi:MAG TPA: hypothetical protein DCM05_08125 [Elusimicrobia bacterium]|nr:hypothetical protein [Elusimicrobiota bacterium]
MRRCEAALTVGLALCALAAGKPQRIASTEKVVLLPWKVELTARTDTGAAVSSLDARDVHVSSQTVRFRLAPELGGLSLELPIAGWMEVRSAEARERRPVVELEFCLAGKVSKARFNLNDRSKVRHPALIGRNVLKQGFVVDVKRKPGKGPACPR